jgi:hypothetical protein
MVCDQESDVIVPILPILYNKICKIQSQFSYYYKMTVQNEPVSTQKAQYNTRERSIPTYTHTKKKNNNHMLTTHIQECKQITKRQGVPNCIQWQHTHSWRVS